MFKRRRNNSVWSQARAFLLPRRGWQRPWQYIVKRTLRIAGSPHAIALGFAFGVFASFTPFMGAHLVVCLALSWVFGASMIASVFGTIIGNPITFPFIWAGTHKLGTWILGGVETDGPDLTGGVFARSFEVLWPLIKPMVVGGAVIGGISAVVSYYLVKSAVSVYQAKRQARLDKMRNEPTGSTSAP
ncbi:MAG: DUF2062 domain-containing protein [Pseudomonadota bacterium]